MTLEFRAATPDDLAAIERLERAEAEHEQCDCPPAEALRSYWFDAPVRSFVVADAAEIVGAFRLRPIREGPGAHVAHAAYLVEPARRGHGIGTRMAERSLIEARRLGYRAMQFGYVPVTMDGSIAMWRRLGFAVVGTLPRCYRDAERGDVDAVVLHRELDDV